MPKLIENPAEPFATACALAGIPATTRQLRKWNQGRGKARAFEPAVAPFEALQACRRRIAAGHSEIPTYYEVALTSAMPKVRFN